ncbi:PREDICTED: UMP-CMP kinase isoform X2 [Nelumbo nucifera]|uniref:UMP-CMP kinase n=1 Tax=Nelumbo nucifera TaxID=4432 RepID=A0A1U8ABI3_NELNU|nr:PREDICTED: UMP-CMP kinase isoform X2 [Nelumbo nucifera]
MSMLIPDPLEPFLIFHPWLLNLAFACGARFREFAVTTFFFEVFLIEQDLIQAPYRLNFLGILSTENGTPATIGFFSKEKTPFIAFVLGGPGSGKGTQCAKIAEAFGFTHLSAGDLLRKEISSNSENGAMILATITEGKIVPSGVTIKLIRREMESIENNKFLIDGFPRSEENRIAFERITGVEPNIVLFFDCPEDEMVKRVLGRKQGRVDDNIDTIKKRLKVFAALNLPVINHYTRRGKVYKINAVGTIDEVFEKVRQVFDDCKMIK